MSLTAANELTIRTAVTGKLTTASISYPLPSPLMFEDKADYWATVNEQSTQKTIETTLATMCVATLRKFEDKQDSACEDNPVVFLTYNLYLFREADFTRVDETDTPDAFNAKLLKAERDFMTDFFNIKQQFIGNQPMVGLPSGYFAWTNSVSMDEFIKEAAECRYIPGVKGFSADLQTVVEVLIQ